jgi:hypothetical protein
MKVIPVQGNSSLARDAKTRAIVNINTSEIEQARQRKKAMKQKDNEIEQLKNDVSEIKELLQQLLRGNNGSF